MRKKLILMALLLLPFYLKSYSQDVILGYTPDEILQEYKGKGLWSWRYTSQYGGYHILVADNYKWTTYYYFKTKTSPCKLSMLFPKNRQTLNQFIKLYTSGENVELIEKNYWKIIGDGEEKLYLLLDYDDNENAYFMYGYLNETL
ncbi:hypothetical protein [Dysgonomonas sp.]